MCADISALFVVPPPRYSGGVLRALRALEQEDLDPKEWLALADALDLMARHAALQLQMRGPGE